MKKRSSVLPLVLIFALVLLLGIAIFIKSFCRVRFADDHSIGGIVKLEDETVEAFIYTSVYNGSFSEKTVTFEVGGGEEYEKYDLKYDKYYNVQIEINEGNAWVNAQGNCITIPRGEEVGITISVCNEYVGDEFKEKLFFFKRDAPKDVSIVIVDSAAQ